ncbi:MAG: amidohydrolase, partial [Pseudomonadales bacterium]
TAAFGITAYTEPGLDEAQANAYKRADSAGELSARVLISLSPASWHTAAFGSEIFDLLAKRDDFRGRYVSAESVKIYIDGVIETRTSHMLQPYEGGEDNFPPFYNQNTLNEFVQKIDAMGVQVHTHAIGDGAIRNALNAYEHARKVNGPGNNRHQITHLQLIDEADIPRFGQLDVAADFQSLWAYPDDYIDVTIPEVGAERVSRFYPIASVVKTGGTIIGGSDWDVSSLNPLEAIEVAVTRQDPWSNKGPILKESERVELATIVDAYTRNAAYVMRLDDVSGSLEVGKSADLIVLDRNLFEIEPSEISEAKVLMTMVDGREVFSNIGKH